MKSLFLGVALAAMCIAVPATAQTAGGTVAKQCAKDIQTHCAGMGHGHPHVRTCLELHHDVVSTECQNALESNHKSRDRYSAKADLKGVVKAQCAPEIETYCDGRNHDFRQTLSCLKQSRDEATPNCQQALDAIGRGHGQRRG